MEWSISKGYGEPELEKLDLPFYAPRDVVPELRKILDATRPGKMQGSLNLAIFEIEQLRASRDAYLRIMNEQKDEINQLTFLLDRAIEKLNKQD